MTRPPWEVADVIHRGGSRFLDRYQNALTWPQVKVLNAIARCRTAALGVTAISVTAAVIGPSHTTPAGTAIARSARPTLVINGFERGNKNCCRLPTITWFSASLTDLFR
jgi:hypothetical protein